METLVKICGITRPEDALHAAKVGASFLGYIFYAPSKRFVAPRTAKEIIKQVRNQYPHVRHVGVFVDEGVETMAWTRNLACLDLLQLHGHEPISACAELSTLGIDVIKALAIGADNAPVDFRQYQTAYYLCDTFDPNLKGGTGRSFDLDKLPADLPPERIFIAGGLTAETVGDLVRERQPYAVDVSTGVEQSPGVKSHRLVTEFISSVHRANQAADQEKVEKV